MNAQLNVVILAAGQGKCMKSALPKVLHPVGGRSMLTHVVATAHALAGTRRMSARLPSWWDTVPTRCAAPSRAGPS